MRLDTADVMCTFAAGPGIELVLKDGKASAFDHGGSAPRADSIFQAGTRNISAVDIVQATCGANGAGSLD